MASYDSFISTPPRSHVISRHATPNNHPDNYATHTRRSKTSTSPRHSKHNGNRVNQRSRLHPTSLSTSSNSSFASSASSASLSSITLPSRAGTSQHDPDDVQRDAASSHDRRAANITKKRRNIRKRRGKKEILNRLATLEAQMGMALKLQDAQQRGVDRVYAEERVHCEGLAATYESLQSLLLTGSCPGLPAQNQGLQRSTIQQDYAPASANDTFASGLSTLLATSLNERNISRGGGAGTTMLSSSPKEPREPTLKNTRLLAALYLLIQKEVQKSNSALESQLRFVLENFKSHVQTCTDAVENRMQEAERAIADLISRVQRVEGEQRAVEESLQKHKTTVRSDIEETLQQRFKEVEVRVKGVGDAAALESSSVERKMQKLAEDVRESIAVQRDRFTEKLNEESSQLRKETTNDMRASTSSMMQRLAELEVSIKAEREKAMADLTKRSEMRLSSTERSLANVSERIASVDLRVGICESSSSSYSRDIDNLRSAIQESRRVSEDACTRTESQLRQLLSEAESRQTESGEGVRRSVSDVMHSMDKLSQRVAALQVDVSSTQDSVRVHETEIAAQRMEGSLEAAFAELRDWMVDIDRRCVSRGDLERVISEINLVVSNIYEKVRSE